MSWLKDKVKDAKNGAVQFGIDFLRDKIPYQTESTFEQDGKITAPQYELAGDNLCSKHPAWKWASGDEDKINKHLNPEKQYLVLAGAICMTRASTCIDEYGKDQEDEGFVVPTIMTATDMDNLIQTIDDAEWSDEDIVEDNATFTGPSSSSTKDTEPSSSSTTNQDDNNSIIPCRTYDISLVYDNFYRSPHIYLIGRDENGELLSPEQMFEDITKGYTKETITIQDHPHLGKEYKHLSIHPCRHASLMHTFRQSNDFPVEDYFFRFLKFIQTVIPTIQYDFTRTIGF